MDGKIMRYGDTMGRDGESLAPKLWRSSAVGVAYSAKAQAAGLQRNAMSVNHFSPAVVIEPLIQFASMLKRGLLFSAVAFQAKSFSTAGKI